MGLEAEIVEEIVDNFLYSYHVKKKNVFVISKDPKSMAYMGFNFKISISENNYDVLITLPENINRKAFDQHIEDIQKPPFWNEYPSIKEKRKARNLKRSIRNIHFIENSNGSYHGKAELYLPKNLKFKDRLVEGSIVFFIQPVLIYERRKKQLIKQLNSK